MGIGFGRWVREELLDKIVSWAYSHNTKSVAIVRLVHPGEASALGVDDIIVVGNKRRGTVEFGIWKILSKVPNFMRI